LSESVKKSFLINFLKTAVKVVFTIYLIYLVFTKVDIEAVKQVFVRSNPLFIGAALIAYILSIVIASWRLNRYLENIGVMMSFRYNLELYFIGLFYNVFLPGGIGGEGYKIYLLHKQTGVPAKRVFWAIFLDRFSGLWSIGLLMAILLCLVPRLEVPLAVVMGVFGFGTLAYYLICQKYFRTYSEGFLDNHWKAILAQIFQLLAVVFILMSQSGELNFAPYLLTFLLSSLATIIPISIGGFGLREVVMLQGSEHLAMDSQIAVFLTLSFSILSTILSLPGLLFIHRKTARAPVPQSIDLKHDIQ
jgi:glycosyltransferase 2 family protein